MGTEIVFVLIYPIAAICLAAAIIFWLRVIPIAGGAIKAYVSLLLGYALSILALAILSYLEGNGTFTHLIQQGYYTESERSLYLPRRVVGLMILHLVFVLPAISFVVVPLTAGLIRKGLLTPKSIAIYALAAWLVLSLIGWSMAGRSMVDPFSFAYALSYSATPVAVYGLPIPLMALLFLKKSQKSEGVRASQT